MNRHRATIDERRRESDGVADLADLLARTPPRLFAVADGALHDDLPGTLVKAGFAPRALYAGEMAAVGPQLVALADRDGIDALLSILGEAPMAVFWSWPPQGSDEEPGEEEALFAHLRRIGRIEVPRAEADESGEDVERVVFRHADPSALMKVLPVFDDDQRAAFMGRARGLILLRRDRDGRGRLVRVPRDGRILEGVA